MAKTVRNSGRRALVTLQGNNSYFPHSLLLGMWVLGRERTKAELYPGL